jgi:hypothetical protein
LAGIVSEFTSDVTDGAELESFPFVVLRSSLASWSRIESSELNISSIKCLSISIFIFSLGQSVQDQTKREGRLVICCKPL